MTSLGSCMGPMSMLTIGFLLADADLKSVAASLRFYRMVCIRLLVCPLIAIVLLKGLQIVWPGEAEINRVLLVSLLGASGPTATSLTQMAQLGNVPEVESLSAVNVVTTLLCTVTMPVMVFLYQVCTF